MRTMLVVLRFLSFELANQVFAVLKDPSSIEFLRIGFVTSLAVGLGTCWRDALVGDAQVGEMPSELRAEGRIVVRLDLLDGKGKCSWTCCRNFIAVRVLLWS